MSAFDHARDRVAFAAEGAWLAAADALDVARDNGAVLLASLAAAVAALVLVLGLDGTKAEPVTATPGPAAGATSSHVSDRGFSLSLPAGWKRTETPRGSAFSASSADGLAMATLWVERDPKLGFEAFVGRSMASLDEIGTDVRVSHRAGGPALESRITELRAEVPLDGGVSAPYRVTLRAAGPYRYYLATSIQPGAPAQLLADAEVLGSTFRPAARIAGVGSPKAD